MTSVLSLAGNVLAGMHYSNNDMISLPRFVRTIELALFVTDIVTIIFQLNCGSIVRINLEMLMTLFRVHIDNIIFVVE